MNNKINRIIIILLSLSYIVLTALKIFIDSYSLIITCYYLFYFIVALYIIDVFIILIISNFNIHRIIMDFLIFSILFCIISYPEVIQKILHIDILSGITTAIILLRNLFFLRNKEENLVLKNIPTNMMKNPAKSILSSYFIIIFIGATFLMVPLATVEDGSLGFINSLFTSTSAVCVTGLTVIDTGSKFTLFGQIVILLLIQIGGLGIMICSTFIAFIIYRKISFENTLALSYLLNDENMSSMFKNIRTIIITTFCIEGIGALLLFIKFSSVFGLSLKSFYYSIFHSVSAFCNAGFALYPDSLISFKSSPFTVFTISLLIISGGVSFPVISNIYSYIRYRLKNIKSQTNENPVLLATNTKIVLVATIVLILAGLFGIYALEHRNSLLKFDIGTQYLCAFFQSVTTRTAGFNSIDLSNLKTPTYLLMMILMYIGGASGSTAGGIKVNTISVLFVSVKSFVMEKENTVVFSKSIKKEIMFKAFIIFTLSLLLIFASIFIMTISENNVPFIKIAFEVVSAFGTVGLSTGITADLSNAGKLIIISLMYIGKLGPLTLFAAVSDKRTNVKIEYPSADIMIG